MDDIGLYEELEFPAFRNPTIDALERGRKKHHIPLLLEIDVTEGRQFLQEIKAGTGEGISFTSWVMKCVARAVSDHRRVHALRKGRRRLVLFADVDIAVIVERSVNPGDPQSETLPMPCVIRKANEKSVREIHDEVRAAQKVRLEQGEVQIGAGRSVDAARLFARLPKFTRNLLLWRRLTRNPFLAKEKMGTVAITSVGDIGKGTTCGWGIPLGIHPLVVALGRVARKPGVVGEAVAIREYLSLTILFDHDVTDGAPAARFAQRLQELLETGYGLSV